MLYLIVIIKNFCGVGGGFPRTFDGTSLQEFKMRAHISLRPILIAQKVDNEVLLR